MPNHTSSAQTKPNVVKNDGSASAFNMTAAILVGIIIIAGIFFIQYRPKPVEAPPQISFEQKMQHLRTGAPLPSTDTRPQVPKWMAGMILLFVIIQVLPLLLAAHKAKLKELTRRDVRQIEFLAETPLYLGLLGSLLGVCMTHFLSGTLSAPLAYLTTISGIILYIFGRFSLLVSLPTTSDFNQE